MVEIAAMRPEHVEPALKLWHGQFLRHLGGAFPDFFPGGEAQARALMLQGIEGGRALAAQREGRLAGYLLWSYFDFHGEASAFCPTIGHAAQSDGEAGIYRALYTAASRRWVADGMLNHLWMTFYDDEVLKEVLYELGFGAHVIDACRRAEQPLDLPDCPFEIRAAGREDLEALFRLAEETRGYYLSAPLFLKRGALSMEDVSGILRSQRVLTAWDGVRLIGAMNFALNPGFNGETLTGDKSARVTGIGAYVDPGYRGAGIGSALVSKMLEDCRAEGRPWVHVSFESANPFAVRFWPRYFRPAIRSVRRTVNKDIYGFIS